MNTNPGAPSPDSTPANTPESTTTAIALVAAPQALVVAPDPASAAKCATDPLEYARMLAKAGGNNLHLVEERAKMHERGLQRGEREVILVEITRNAKESKQHEQGERAARRRFNRSEESVPSKDGGIPMPWWRKVLFVMLLVCWLGGLLCEHYGAASALMETGAFNVHTIGQGLLLTSTCIAVGFALKLVFGAFPPAVRRCILATACAALVTLFAVWGWNFALEVNKAANENGRAAEYQAGENLGEGGQDPAVAGEVPAQEKNSSSAWRMFFALTGMMVLTTFLGMAGMEHSLSANAGKDPNPVRASAQNEINLHSIELRRLSAERGSLNQQLAQFADRENGAVAAAIAEYLTARGGAFRSMA